MIIKKCEEIESVTDMFRPVHLYKERPIENIVSEKMFSASEFILRLIILYFSYLIFDD